jgi:hypothetical protein
MCSTPVQRIAEIGQAIDDLAADARTAYRQARPTARGKAASPATGRAEPCAADQPGSADPSGVHDEAGIADPAHAAGPADNASTADAASSADQVMIRLAALWGQLAELDPEVARRLPTYDA